ncbi:hypothetical protein ASZ78_000746 [Callipepla squamata]|uniref:Anaphase-promoting complex subunit 4 WD40 domain-containing protein n=1 Tax=Callipepla squamata TaxID=9009 RepID=A0A226MKZ2_CALSU|nr:hypothetical protein ASZ78_000746 [Callipepla squamata]
MFCLPSLVQALDSERTAYSMFKSSIKRKLAARAPVASSPIVTRWQQRHAGDLAAEPRRARGAYLCALRDSRLVSTRGRTPDKLKFYLMQTRIVSIKIVCLFSVTNQVLKKPTVMKSAVTLPSRHTRRNDKKTEIQKKKSWSMRCLDLHSSFLNHTNSKDNSEDSDFFIHIFTSTHGQKHTTQQGIGYNMAESVVKVCENSSCVWKGCQEGIQNQFRTVPIMKPSVTLEPELRIHVAGLHNDYYLNILDWNLENLIAVALGSAAYIWNGRTLQGIECIDLNSSSKYISSLAWIKEGTCLAIGTSDGEVQVLNILLFLSFSLWDIERKRRLRNMFGHLSVVGALSWNHYILSRFSQFIQIFFSIFSPDYYADNFNTSSPDADKYDNALMDYEILLD